MYAGKKQRGSQFDYSEQSILVMLTVKEVFHLTNRGVEGFMRSIFQLIKINLPVPDHSTLSKRDKDLEVNLLKKTSRSLKIVMDSTRLKIYGELSARMLETQTTQVFVRCAALNKMTNLGMPQSYKVA